MNKVYGIITQRIIQELEKGEIPWEKTWTSSYPQNYISKKEYKGINLILLSLVPHKTPYWLTYKQVKDKGGYVKKGERGTQIIFWKQKIIKEINEDGEEVIVESYPILRYYTVFNLDQTNLPIPTNEQRIFNPIKEAENILAGYTDKPTIEEQGNQPCYIPAEDKILIPTKTNFKTEQNYYSTLFHELVHSTGHEKRLNRKGITELNEFGGFEYSKEELIAELGACFLCNRVGIESKTHRNTVGYIQNWLQALKNDVTLIVRAGSKAQKAVDYIIKGR